MGMHALIEDGQQAAIAEAQAQANQWTLAAKPVIRALLLIDDAEYELRNADDRARSDGRSALSKATKHFREMLDGIRDEFISEAMPKQPTGAPTVADWAAYDDAWDAFDDALRATTSVQAAITAVINEDLTR